MAYFINGGKFGPHPFENFITISQEIKIGQEVQKVVALMRPSATGAAVKTALE